MMPQAAVGLFRPRDDGKTDRGFSAGAESAKEVFRGQLSGVKGEVSPGARLLLALGSRDRPVSCRIFLKRPDFPEQRSLPRASSKDWPWPQDLSSFPCPGPMEA